MAGKDERLERDKQEGNEEYNHFLDKFATKKTTDDCYTPEPVYQAVLSWVRQRYNIPEGAEIMRPFYPGGDFAAEDYRPGCVVVDNPPFSILSQIVDFFVMRRVPFFLFAPGLTCFTYARRPGVTVLPQGCSILYDNGAEVSTSFLTNMSPEYSLETCPELTKAIDEAVKVIRKEATRELPKYVYPYEVLTAARASWMCQHGEALRIKRGECVYIPALDAMRAQDKTIYGGGLLLSERAAAERAAAERAAAERAAAERAAADVWHMSARERRLMQTLDGSTYEQTSLFGGGEPWPQD